MWREIIVFEIFTEMRFFSISKKGGKRMQNQKENFEISVDAMALVLIELAYSEGLIKQETYQSVIKQYGGDFYGKVYE